MSTTKLQPEFKKLDTNITTTRILNPVKIGVRGRWDVDSHTSTRGQKDRFQKDLPRTQFYIANKLQFPYDNIRRNAYYGTSQSSIWVLSPAWIPIIIKFLSIYQKLHLMSPKLVKRVPYKNNTQKPTFTSVFGSSFLFKLHQIVARCFVFHATPFFCF